MQSTAAYSFKDCLKLSNYWPKWEPFALERKKANRRDASILDLQIWHLEEKLKCARSLEPQRL